MLPLGIMMVRFPCKWNLGKFHFTGARCRTPPRARSHDEGNLRHKTNLKEEPGDPGWTLGKSEGGSDVMALGHYMREMAKSKGTSPAESTL